MTRRPSTRTQSDTLTPVTLAEERDLHLEKLAANLEIDMSALEREIAAQPELFHRAARHYAEVCTARDARRRELRGTEARVDMQLRRAAVERAIPTTDAAVTVQVGDHADVVRHAKALDLASQRVRTAKLLCRAFKQRAQMLECLVSLRSIGRR